MTIDVTIPAPNLRNANEILLILSNANMQPCKIVNVQKLTFSDGSIRLLIDHIDSNNPFDVYWPQDVMEKHLGIPCWGEEYA